MNSNPIEDKQAFGFWPSDISAAMVAKANKRIRQVASLERAGENPVLVWVEARPELGGRCVLMLRDHHGEVKELLNKPEYSVRSLINSYGGGALLLTPQAVYFVNHNPGFAFNDQRIYRLALDHNFNPVSSPTALTPAQHCSYGDLHYDAVHQRIICVREAKINAVHSEHSIIAVPLNADSKKSELIVLARGYDFYASPSVNEQGRALAYIAWNQPNMPWDHTDLIVQRLNKQGLLDNKDKLNISSYLAGSTAASIQQARWHSDDKLYFVSDHEKWWRLYCYDPIADEVSALIDEPALNGLDEAEFGSPAWELGLHSYDFISEQHLAALCNKNGRWQLLLIDLGLGENNVQCIPIRLSDSALPEEADFLAHLHAVSGSLVCIAGSANYAAQLIEFNLKTAHVEVVSETLAKMTMPSTVLSKPESICFAVENIGQDNEVFAHALFYAPTSNVVREDGRLPPLIIKTHGGPTSSTTTQLDLSIQFFTTRGFAVVDVNYRGSNGYGCDYRHALYGRWGEADLQDCVACIDYLVQEKRIDGQRVFARGQSAGGYLTLMLACFTSRLCAGAITAGISSLEQLYLHTHKFEKDYLYNLLGCYPDADIHGVYQSRSPINAEQAHTPLLFIQGEEDRVVPPSQTNMMMEKLQKEGVRAECLLFSDEQHGLRRSKNIEKALQAELIFFQSFLMED